jgi:transposase InsO family protein
VAAPPELAGTVNRSRWLPIAGLGLALLMVTLDIFEYLEVVHKRQRRHSSLGMLTPIEFENAFTVA